MIAALALTLFAARPPAARASELSEDLQARRSRVLEALPRQSVLILWSAPARNYSLDIDYEYRQESNLYYLTGLVQQDTILVLIPGDPVRREVLFVKERDLAREHWDGRLLSPEEASARTGITAVMTTAEFEPFIEQILAGGNQLALLLPGENPDVPPSPSAAFAKRMGETFVGLKDVDATPILTNLRMVKTPYEQKVLVKSLEISSDAQMVGMHAARPGAYEYQVKAAIEGSYRASGAVSWSYPSIVASGPNATILHYPADDRQMQSGELLLVDAAANYGYMSGDITRTYPVSGRFTAAQKDIYAIVLQAQEEGIKAAVPGGSLASIHDRTVEVIKAGLFKLGLITDTSGDQYRLWYTHGATHYIGIDVHDVGDRNAPLVAGMSFVIEPGIYIREAALDTLAKTPDNLALITTIRPAVTKYLDIGVRVEDSFLLESSGLKRLSASLPRTVDQIEAFMRHK
jgi:Xaa-Pro aminopeptidase